MNFIERAGLSEKILQVVGCKESDGAGDGVTQAWTKRHADAAQCVLFKCKL